MPKLRQVLEHELAAGPGLEGLLVVLSEALLEGEIVEVFFATGAPCDSHAGAFADWPGPEQDVTQWFRLDGGVAVGIRSREGAPLGLAFWEPEPDA